MEMDSPTSSCHSIILVAASSLPLLPILITLLYMSFNPFHNSVSPPQLIKVPITHLRLACSLMIRVVKNPKCTIQSNTNSIKDVQPGTIQYYYKCEPGSATVECAICLSQVVDGEEIGEVRCTHVFHKGCLDSWLARKITCPVCRCQVIIGEEKIVIPLRLMQHRTSRRSRDQGDNFWLR